MKSHTIHDLLFNGVILKFTCFWCNKLKRYHSEKLSLDSLNYL